MTLGADYEKHRLLTYSRIYSILWTTAIFIIRLPSPDIVPINILIQLCSMPFAHKAMYTGIGQWSFNSCIYIWPLDL